MPRARASDQIFSDLHQIQEQIPAALVKKPKAPKRSKSKTSPLQLPGSGPTEAGILAGDFDLVPMATRRSTVVLMAILTAVGREWHGGRTLVTVKARVRAWENFVDAGGLPSQALKAVFGLRHDPWDKRGEVGCTVNEICRDPERWVKLYEDRHVTGARPRWPRKGVAVPPGFRPWKGILVPADRQMSHGDELALAAGYVFVFDGREWVDPLDDRRGLVPQHQAKFGDANVTELAFARMQTRSASHG